MNERIRQLAIRVQRTEMPGVLFAHPEFVEKFAELIVRECADLVADDDNAFDVLKHFGVES